MSNLSWIDNKYKKSKVLMVVEADVYHRIPEHKVELEALLKDTLKAVELANGNVRIRRVKKL